MKKTSTKKRLAGFILRRAMMFAILLVVVKSSLYAGSVSGTFTTLSACPVNLSAMAVDPSTGYFYAVADQNQTAATYRYNAATNTWTNMNSAPPHQTGNNAGATFLNGKIYVSYTSYPDLAVYDVAGNSWTTITGPTGGTNTGDISNDGTNVYVACSGTPGKFWRYNVSGGTWTALASVPKNQNWGGLSYKNGYFYSSEGNGGTGFQRYQVSTDIWTSLDDVPGGAVLGAAIYDAFYYCMGSYGGTNLYSYDLGSQTWNNILTLPWTINDATICVYNNSLYIIQGEAGTGFSKFTPNNPMLTAVEGTPLTYNLGDAAINVTSTLVASQNAGTNFASATVSIVSGFQSGKDVLSFTNANGITGSWNSGTGILTLTGTSSIANYQAALRSVKYVNNDLTSGNATRKISFVVYDGAIYSNTASRFIAIPGPPTVSTAAVSSISGTTAMCGGAVTDDGTSTVTARGVCWNTTGSPLVTDSHTTNGSGLGSFTSSITGLTVGNTYYVRAYATNAKGTNYGSEVSFIAGLCSPSPSTNACGAMWITNISTTGGLTNFSNASACTASSYSNYSATKSVSQAPSGSVTINFTSSGYALNYAVWIDFNDDAVFSASEKVLSFSNSSLTVSKSFTVPAAAPPGSHRMRIMGDYYSDPVPGDPCATLDYGETEDYAFVVANPAPANPTSVTASVNPICNGGSTVLTANGVDGTVYWYTESCGGTQVGTGNTLTVSPLVTTTYYARNYNNGLFSAGCANITVTAYSVLTANISGGSSPICYNSAPGTLTATGGGGNGTYTYLWYKNGASTGVTTQTYAPGNLTSTSAFYCAVTSGSCGTVNTPTTTITVYSTLTAGISGGTTPICYNTAPGTLTATGTGGNGTYTYLWYKNGVSTGVTTQTYAPGNLTSTSAFYCAVTSGSCGTVNTTTTSITVYSNLTAGISGGSTPICYNTSPGSLTATGSGGDGTYTYLWYQNGISTGITTQDYAPGNLLSTSTFYCAVSSGSCGTVNTPTQTITVYADLAASISGGSSPICYNSLPGTFTASATGGTGSYTYLWFKDGQATAVTTNMYVPASLTAASSFYCEVSSGSCGTVSTPVSAVAVYNNFVNGSILTDGETICYDGDPGLIGNLTGASGGDESITYQWQSSPDAAFTTPVTLTGSNSLTYDPPAGLRSTTWYRRLAKDGSCNAFMPSDGIWKVTVRNQFVAPIVSSNQIICWNTTASPLTATAATGGTGPYTYQWQMSSDGVAWNNIAGATALTLLPGSLFETTSYRLLATDSGTPACETLKASNVITIVVRDPYTPSVISIAGNKTICYNSAPGLLTATPTMGGSGPTYTYQWQMKTTGNWMNVGTNNTSYQPGNLTANAQFRLIAFDNGTPACGSVFSLNNLSVTVQSAVYAGVIGSDQTICSGTIPAALTSVENGATSTPGAILSYRWEYSVNAGESWQVIEAASGATYAPAALTQTTLFRRTALSALNGVVCESVPAQVKITVDALPVAVAGGSQAICSNTSATISGASYANGTIQWTSNGSGTIASGDQTLTPVYNASADDAGKTVTLTMTVSSDNVCAPQSAVAMYTLDVSPLPTAKAGGSQSICANGTATVMDAAASNGDILWSHNGSGTLSDQTTLAPTYTASSEDAGKLVTLTMTVSSTNACAPQTAVAEYTVHVDPLPTAVAGGSQTICSGGVATVEGASASNGTILWTSDGEGMLTAETTLAPVYTAAEADAGKTVTLTLTVSSDNNCAPEKATATYSIVVRPTFVAPIVSANQQICYSSQVDALIAAEAKGGSGGYAYQWQYSDDGLTNWTNIEGATDLSYSPGVLLSTTSFRILATDKGTPACADAVESNVVTVKVNDPLYPPIIHAESDQTTVCFNGIPALFTAEEATGGTGPFTYQWQQSANGINNWVNVGPNSIDNITYQAEAATADVYYRVIAKDAGMPSCGSTFSNVLAITVKAVPTAGVIGEDQTICNAAAPDVIASLTDGTGSGDVSYRWEQSTDGIAWTALQSSAASLSPGILTQTTWFRRITISTLSDVVCESDPTLAVKIEVLKPAAFAGADRDICIGASTVIGTEAVAGSTYSWTSAPGTFVSAEANPTVSPEETTTYTLVETFTETGCTDSHSVVVTVDPIPVPVITGDAVTGVGGTGAVYTTDEGFSGYAWVISEGGEIITGDGTNSIRVLWTAAGTHNLTVEYINAGGCGPLTPTSFSVEVTPVPDAAVVSQAGDTLSSSAPEGNQWYRDGVPVEGATGTQFVMDQPGTYYVVVTINGNSSEPSNSITLLPVSISDFEVSHSFDVYPNPSHGQFTIRVSSPKPVDVNIEVVNSIGVQVWKKEKVTVDGTFTATVSLNILPNGVYTVSIYNRKMSMARKIVIMK